MNSTSKQTIKLIIDFTMNSMVNSMDFLFEILKSWSSPWSAQRQDLARRSQHLAVGRAIEGAKVAKAQTEELTQLLADQGTGPSVVIRGCRDIICCRIEEIRGDTRSVDTDFDMIVGLLWPSDNACTIA